MRVTSKKSGGVLTIAGPLHIAGVSELRNALADALGRQARRAIDVSAAETCDVAVLQLLCATRKSAARLQKQFYVVAISQAVAVTCTALGFPIQKMMKDAEVAAELTSASDSAKQAGERGE